jgi:hypothetical protein
LLTKDEARRIAANIAKLPGLFPRLRPLAIPHGFSYAAGPDMPHPGTNERKYPHIVELAVSEDALDFGLGRSDHALSQFTTHQVAARPYNFEGRQNIYYRWCFADLPTARSFSEQFGGSLHEPNR